MNCPVCGTPMRYTNAIPHGYYCPSPACAASNGPVVAAAPAAGGGGR